MTARISRAELLLGAVAFAFGFVADGVFLWWAGR